MPFDSTIKAIRGDDAKTPLDFTRKTFCTWLAAKLNDANGPYATALKVTPVRRAFVVEDAEIARAMYRRKDAPPVASLVQGPSDSMDWWVGDERGERIEIEWMLDCGVADTTPTDDDLALERRDDSNLAGFVRDAVKRGFDELNALGLFNLDIEPDTEKQRAGEGRHPHKITLFVRVLP